jgi:hypothetical protein
VKVVGSLILVALLIGFGSQSPASASSGTTVRASEARGGQDATRNSSWPSVSDDGRFVAFSSWASNLVPHDLKDSSDIFIRDLLTSTTTRVSVDSNGSEANGSSFTPSISADGNVVASLRRHEPGRLGYRRPYGCVRSHDPDGLNGAREPASIGGGG